MVPLELVLRMDEGIWKSVVEPVFDMANSVVVESPTVEEEMAKRVRSVLEA
jgi:hypothetical protein